MMFPIPHSLKSSFSYMGRTATKPDKVNRGFGFEKALSSLPLYWLSH